MQNTPQNQSQPMSEDTKTIITVIVLLGFYPVGIVLMWIWTRWAAWIKWLITILGCLPFIIAGIFIIATIMINAGEGVPFPDNPDGMYQNESDLRINLDEEDTFTN